MLDRLRKEGDREVTIGLGGEAIRGEKVIIDHSDGKVHVTSWPSWPPMDIGRKEADLSGARYEDSHSSRQRHMGACTP